MGKNDDCLNLILNALDVLNDDFGSGELAVITLVKCDDENIPSNTIKSVINSAIDNNKLVRFSTGEETIIAAYWPVGMVIDVINSYLFPPSIECILNELAEITSTSTSTSTSTTASVNDLYKILERMLFLGYLEMDPNDRSIVVNKCIILQPRTNFSYHDFMNKETSRLKHIYPKLSYQDALRVANLGWLISGHYPCNEFIHTN